MRAALILLVALGAACRPPPRPTQRTVVDALGRTVALGATRRIVSLAPSSTEIVAAMGAADLLVGVDRYSDWPATLRGLPRVGTDMEPSTERIVALRPDLVLIATSANAQRSMEVLVRAGIPVYVSRAVSLDDIFADIAGIGRALDREGAAAALAAAMRARLDAARARVAGRPRTSAVVVVWPSPLVVAARGSHVGDLLAAAGGNDLIDDGAQPFPTYSTERLVQLHPSVLIVGTHSAGAPSLDPLQALSTIPAIRDRRVHLVDGDLLFRPGPRAVDAIEALVPLLHPELADGGTGR